MKGFLKPIGFFCALTLPAMAQFTPGNLAVLRLGNGTETLVNAGNSVFIDQYTLSGSLVNSVPVPSTGPAGLVIHGTATADGALSRSADGRFLTFATYNRAVGGSGSVASTTSAAVPRTIGIVDVGGTFSPGPATTTQFSTSNFRSAATDGNNNFWALGGNSGTYYFGNSAPAVTIQSGIGNGRVMNFFNGNLLFSTGVTGGQGQGIYGFQGDGAPFSPVGTNQLIATGAGSSPYDFAFNGAGTIAYIADDRTLANGGGIQRWDLVGGVWTLSYTLGTGSGSTVGARGLAVDFTSPDPTIYATTAETSGNRLIGLLDAGSGSIAATLATAGPNTIFRGLDFAPVPEPGSLVLLLAGALALLVLHRRR